MSTSFPKDKTKELYRVHCSSFTWCLSYTSLQWCQSCVRSCISIQHYKCFKLIVRMSRRIDEGVQIFHKSQMKLIFVEIRICFMFFSSVICTCKCLHKCPNDQSLSSFVINITIFWLAQFYDMFAFNCKNII